MSSNSREARRRKILERGSDRLAFITGQINGVPPPPSSDSSSLPPSHLSTDESLPVSTPPRDQISTDREIGFASQPEKNYDSAILDNADHIIHQTRAESPQPQKYAETLLGESSTSASRNTTRQPSPAISSDQTPSVMDLGASQAFTPLVSFVNNITPNHIGAAIDASEFARMFSALLIALLVILSHLGFSSLANVVSFRPVFLLLLTDTTIVLGRLLLSHNGNASSSPRQENSATVVNGQGIADQVTNALETVMMIKKIMDAILMDFSLYALLLICGLLFTKTIFA